MNQHFIPEFLLRGFAHRVKGRNHYVFLFRRDEPPRETNTKNVATSRFFYGSPTETTADEILTRREGRAYAPLVGELRRGSIHPEQKPLVDEFVTHLIVRTKNARDAVASLGEAALDAIDRQLETASGRTVIRARAKVRILENPGILQALASLSRSQRRRILAHLDKPLICQDPRQAMEELRRELGEADLLRLAARAQATALETVEAPRLSTGSLAPFRWSVVTMAAGDLVLGDLGPLAQFGDDIRAPLHGGDPLDALFLPVSSRHLLIGAPDGARLETDADTINRASAGYSREFFVASQNTEREREYQVLLGQRSLDHPDWMDRAAHRAFERGRAN